MTKHSYKTSKAGSSTRTYTCSRCKYEIKGEKRMVNMKMKLHLKQSHPTSSINEIRGHFDKMRHGVRDPEMNEFLKKYQ